MKELYEAPEAKLIAFAATMPIAATADWDWSQNVEGGNGGSSDIDADFGGQNPEGSFWN